MVKAKAMGVGACRTGVTTKKENGRLGFPNRPFIHSRANQNYFFFAAFFAADFFAGAALAAAFFAAAFLAIRLILPESACGVLAAATGSFERTWTATENS